MRAPAALVLVAMAVGVATGSAAALGSGLQTSDLALPLDAPAPSPDALAAPEAVDLAPPAALPELAGASDLVAHAASLVASEEPLDAAQLGALAAEQQLKAALTARTPTWGLDRLLAPLPPLPVAAVGTPSPVARIGTPEARAAVAAAGALVTTGALGLALGNLPFLPGYTRIGREETMLNRRRAQMYDIVRREPGIHLSGLVRQTGLGWGAALYHLSVLEKQRVLVVRNEGGFKRYFANGAHQPQDMHRLAALRHAGARALFQAIQSVPGLGTRELRAASGLSPSSLARATDRLEAAGLIQRVRVGRRMLYYPARPAGVVADDAQPAVAGAVGAAA